MPETVITTITYECDFPGCTCRAAYPFNFGNYRHAAASDGWSRVVGTSGVFDQDEVFCPECSFEALPEHLEGEDTIVRITDPHDGVCPLVHGEACEHCLGFLGDESEDEFEDEFEDELIVA